MTIEAVYLEDGRVYFWNNDTDETSWDAPIEYKRAEVRQINLANNFIGDLENVVKLSRLRTCIQMFMYDRLKEVLHLWHQLLKRPTGKVEGIKNALDAWLRSKKMTNATEKSLVCEIATLENKLWNMSQNMENIIADLKATKLRLACVEFENLKLGVRKNHLFGDNRADFVPLK